jgi:hypothetical protein
MLMDSCKSLWHTLQLSMIGFLWKNQCNANFHAEPSLLSLKELRLFKHELALIVEFTLLVKVKFSFSAMFIFWPF